MASAKTLSLFDAWNRTDAEGAPDFSPTRAMRIESDTPRDTTSATEVAVDLVADATAFATVRTSLDTRPAAALPVGAMRSEQIVGTERNNGQQMEHC